jgi:NAD(P)-dependent dehydrogenase (short-subunit alcohol dehydrogenase family)
VSVVLDLSGRRIVVTGAGSGIGAACAQRLAEAGAEVVVADLRIDAAESCADAIRTGGGRAVAVQLDVSDQMATERVAADLASTHPVTGLVNCAATWTLGRFIDADPGSWQHELQVTLVGTLLVTRALLPQLAAGGGGTVVNISSDAGRVGERNQVVYSAAKAGVIGFTKALAREVGGDSIRVNCIAPGLTRTPASAAYIEGLSERDIARAYPLGRLGEPQDIADLTVFLSSDLSSWITGQVVSVSGGYTTVG